MSKPIKGSNPFLSAIKKRLRALFLRREKVERALDKKGAVTGGDDAQGDFFNFCFFVV